MPAYWIISVLLVGCAMAQDSQPADQRAPAAGALQAQSSVDEILDALDRRGRDLRSLVADVKLSEVDEALGNATARSGKFWLENLPDGGTRARILFDRRETERGAVRQMIEYVLAGRNLVDRNYEKKQQTTYVVLRPGEKMNLLKLGEGPFPLPIGQRKESVHAAFEVKKIEPSDDDPADTVHVQLTPKPSTSMARKFHSVDVWVGTKDELPRRIETLDRNELTRRITDLKNVQINQPIADADIALTLIDLNDWTVNEQAMQD